MKKLFKAILVILTLISFQTANSQSCKADFDYWVLDSTNTYYFENKGSFASSYIYYWDFGDGDSSKQFSPQHTFKKNGTYTVCNIVTNITSRCSDTLCIQVVANGKNPCNANFKAVRDSSNSLKFNFIALDTSEEFYTWQIKSSTISTKKSTAYTFSNKGYYDLSLAVINSKDHCKATVVKRIAAGCMAMYSYSVDHSKKTVFFTNLSSSNTNTFTWQFNDGTSSFSKDPTHTFAKTGTYKVTLIASDSNSKCGDTISFSITINSKCNSNISYYTTDTVLNYYVFQSGRLSVFWDFGDGNYSFSDSGKHHYKSAGTYKVCVVVICSTPDTSISCKTITVSAKPKCKPKFGYKKSSSLYTIIFSDSSAGKFKYTWRFGDGTTSTLKNPTHKYSKPGTYRVNLFVTDSTNSCTDSASKIITIYPPCASTFKTTLKDSLLIFYTTSINKKGQKWDFNDGTFSTVDSGQHIYTRPGTYTFCQTVYCLDNDSAKSCTVFTIKNRNACSISAKIIAEQDTQNYVVNLKSSTTSSKYSVLWQYYGNKAKSSTSKNISLNYGSPSFERVYLSVYDSVKNCVDTTSLEIAFHPVGKKCVANFAVKASTYDKFEYHFFSFTAGKGVVNTWIIDSVVQKPSKAALRYIFKTTGKHTVVLLIDDTLTKCKDTIRYNLSIAGNCIQNFTWKPTSNLREIEFDADSSSSTSKYFWDFGDSTSSTTRKLKHTYKKDGAYKVCLKVKCSATDSFTLCKTVTIKSCNALFTVALDTSKKYKLFLINRSSNTSSTTYLWDFGDGTSSTTRNPTHAYTSFGKFNICLKVSDAGCTSVYCDSIGLDSTGKLLKATRWELVVIDEMVFGINTPDKPSVKIYPNPAKQSVTIETHQVTNKFEKLEIFDIQGRSLIDMDINLGNESITLDISNLNSGLYTLRLSNSGNVIYAKIMKN